MRVKVEKQRRTKGEYKKKTNGTQKADEQVKTDFVEGIYS